MPYKASMAVKTPWLKKAKPVMRTGPSKVAPCNAAQPAPNSGNTKYTKLKPEGSNMGKSPMAMVEVPRKKSAT